MGAEYLSGGNAAKWLFNFMTYPILLNIEEKLNILFRADSQVCPYLTISELIDLRQKIDNTIDFYNSKGWDNKNIENENDMIEKELLEKYKQFKSKKVKREKGTFLYLMVDENTGYIKIGKSDNVLKREKTLQSEKPTIKLIKSYLTNESMEALLHNKYDHLRIRGEWFWLDKSHIQEIDKMLSK